MTETRTLANFGECGLCGRYFRLTKAGKLWCHNGDHYTYPFRRCAGVGTVPIKTREQFA